MTDAKIRMTTEDWAEAIEEGEPILWSYLWVLGEVYDVPLTNNYPRVFDGRQLRMVGDFMSDVREAFVRSGWRPETAPQDGDWKNKFDYIKPWGKSK